MMLFQTTPSQRPVEAGQRLADHVQAKRQELQQAEERLRAAFDHLSKLLGRRIDFTPVGPNSRPPENRFDPRTGREERNVTPVDPRARPNQDLEQKLDRLLREVDELRRELRRNQPRRGNFGGGGQRRGPLNVERPDPNLRRQGAGEGQDSNGTPPAVRRNPGR